MKKKRGKFEIDLIQLLSEELLSDLNGIKKCINDDEQNTLKSILVIIKAHTYSIFIKTRQNLEDTCQNSPKCILNAIRYLEKYSEIIFIDEYHVSGNRYIILLVS